uniref:F-box domain-containing protein n=1 Tax=Glossina pallidipes TaxID=7398 RepID=A0A1A9ZN11_GLOPL
MAESVIDDNASKVTIFDLNFDCLSKIFNSLELDNLLDLRKVCDFFDDVVVKYFRRSKIIKIDDKFIVKYSKYMREYLSIISESVEDLVFKIESEYEPDKITNLIENLVFDQVHTLEVDDPFTEQLMPITNFPNVVTLRCTKFHQVRNKSTPSRQAPPAYKIDVNILGIRISNKMAAGDFKCDYSQPAMPIRTP